jgi:hypothetical protein
MDNTDPPKKKRGRPRKEKAPKEKKPRGRPRGQSQKQKQSQNVKVVIHNAPAAKRRYRRKPAAAAPMAAMPQMLPLPPRVIEVPVPVPFEKPSSAPVVVPSVAKKEVGTDTMIPVAESAGMETSISPQAERKFVRPRVISAPPAAAVDEMSPRITEAPTPRKSSMFDNIGAGVGVSESESEAEPKTPKRAESSFGISPILSEAKPSAPILSEMKTNNVMMDNVSVSEDVGASTGDEMSDVGSSISGAAAAEKPKKLRKKYTLQDAPEINDTKLQEFMDMEGITSRSQAAMKYYGLRNNWIQTTGRSGKPRVITDSINSDFMKFYKAQKEKSMMPPPTKIPKSKAAAAAQPARNWSAFDSGTDVEPQYVFSTSK